jgi:hypothetical protein
VAAAPYLSKFKAAVAEVLDIANLVVLVDMLSRLLKLAQLG